RQREIGVAGEIAGQELGGVDHHLGHAVLDRGEHLLVAGHYDVAAEHQLGAAGRDADGVDVLGTSRDAHVAVDRAALLRQPGHVEHADALALEVRGHAENATDGDDAGAADAGDDDVVGLPDRRQLRLRQRHLGVVGGDAAAALEGRAVHGHERRAEAFDAGIVLVAAGLVDGALAAPLGLQRLHRHAVRFHPAVAAAFAHQLVDDDPLVGIGELAALAPAALLGGAGLVVDQHGAAGDRRQLALHRHQVVAVVNGEPRGPVLAAGILPRLVGDHDDLLGA